MKPESLILEHKYFRVGAPSIWSRAPKILAVRLKIYTVAQVLPNRKINFDPWSSLLYDTQAMLALNLLPFENKKYTVYNHFHFQSVWPNPNQERTNQNTWISLKTTLPYNKCSYLLGENSTNKYTKCKYSDLIGVSTQQ